MARLHYTGETKPVAVKQSAWEGSATHPELDGAKSGAREATETPVVGHSGHDGASNDDGDVPATAVDKMVNQLDTKHHGIVAKLKQGFTRSEAHRRALATTAQPRRRCCRP